MQRFKVDIQRPSVPIVINVKQQDTNARLIQLSLYDDGSPYTPPAGAVATVYYDTPAGVGNYTRGVTIKGNVVEFAMANPALTNAGTGVACIVIQTEDKRKIGLWNMEIRIESVPGLDSAVVSDWFTALDDKVAAALAAANRAEEAAKTIDPSTYFLRTAGDSLTKRVSGAETKLDNIEGTELPGMKSGISDLTDGVSRLNSKTTQHDEDIQDIKGLYTESGISHNGIYRGKRLGAAPTPEQYAAIASGDFTDMFIGDFWRYGPVVWRIAGFDYLYGRGDKPLNRHHVVIVPVYIMAPGRPTSQMFPTDDTKSGYANSTARAVLKAMEQSSQEKDIFGEHLLTHRTYLVNDATGGIPTKRAWYDSVFELMCEQMVYGNNIMAPESTKNIVVDNAKVETTQLPLFRLNPEALITAESYWLRDTVSTVRTAYVSSTGLASASNSSVDRGLRPYFLIG